MKTLKGKIIFFGIAICLMASTLVSVYSFKLSRSHLIEEKINEEENNLNVLSESIQSKINELKTDVRFLSSTPPIRGILRASRNNGIDPKDGSSIETWKDRLGTIFTEILEAKQRYIQVRYISMEDEGAELVRVERFAGKVFRETESNLQGKSEEAYFKDLLNVDPNRIYLSPFSLNREYGKVVYPLQMVIRAAIPIYEELGKPFAFVIINVDYTSLFKGLDQFTAGGIEYLVINDKDRILFNSEKERVIFGRESRHFFLDDEQSKSIVKELKKLNWNTQKNKSVGIAESKENFYLSKRINYNALNPDDALIVSLKIDKSILMKKIEADQYGTIALLVFLMLISVGFSILFAKKLVSPIEKLMELTSDISKGKSINFEEFRVQSDDEIGMLTKTYIELSKDILVKNHQLSSQKMALDSFAIVAETDTTGRITYVNDKFIEISGYERDELIGRDHRILNSGHHPKEFFKEMWDSIKNKRIWKNAVKNKAKDGSYYWVDTTIFPIVNEMGDLQKFVAIRYDITERLEIESELRSASKEAKRAVEAKSSFLANVSHEIRTPLNGILGFTELLLSKELDSDIHQEIKHIKDCSSGLLQIINDVLDLSKIEAGKLNIENISMNIDETIRSSLTIFQSKCLEKSITLQYSIDSRVPKYIDCDPMRVRQILINLIGNAVKFTKSGGNIDINVSIDEMISTNNYKLLFSVKDSGIGIAKEAQKRLFRSFEQADQSTTRNYGGTGLGLTICKKIVELFQGKIWLESEIGSGSTFYFTLVARESNREESLVELTKNSEGSGYTYQKEENGLIGDQLRILIAEDNLINQKVIKGFLKQFDEEDITFAPNGQVATELVIEDDYDIVFMDIQMPVMDGYRACELIKTELKKDQFIVGLSANAFDEDKEKAAEVGMDDYIHKPINKDELLRVLSIARKLKDKNKGKKSQGKKAS